jgi:integrase
VKGSGSWEEKTMSTIYRRAEKGNTWYIEFKDAEGKGKRKSLRTKDKREAMRLKTDIDRRLVERKVLGEGVTPLTVSELLERYIPYAHQRYGRASDDHRFEYIRKQVGNTLVGDFGPLALKALRQTWVDNGLCRRTCNAYTKHVRQIFKWGVSEQMVSAEQYGALMTVEGLRLHESKAFDYPNVTNVDMGDVDKTVAFLPPTLQDMVRLQYLTAARPGEILLLRPCDLDRSGDYWRIQVTKGNEDRRWDHKTEHKSQRYGKDENNQRWLYLCDEARAILECRLKVVQSPTEYFFNPQQSIKEWAGMRFPNAVGRRANQKPNPRICNRQISDHYDTGGYRTAIQRACKRAEVPRWTPNQLRHTRATEIERQFVGDKEAVRVLLGHKDVDTQRWYVLEDQKRAFNIVKEL